MRIVFDTNIFIAAALKGSFSEDILKISASTRIVTVLTSEDILKELKQKLIDKFHWEYDDVEFFAKNIREVCEVVTITEKVSVITHDPDDNIILECAVSGKANLIVSSDQDLIDPKTFRGIGIIHPKTLTWTLPEYFKKQK